ncbi:DUF317 domain-containing protein [Kitasatospora sp. NPDC059599]|uniref:DUF317 domain-containing protein n=1 Tax=Kitasatospora sp. NPDC059599 TaxID=3346880 RepID=UPI0036BB6982
MPHASEKPREYRVTPRYLANSDADVSPPIQRLLAAGWALSHDELANTFVTAPDLRARLAFLPEGEDATYWKISAGRDAFAPPDWLVTFDHKTPPEVVEDFTAALANAYAQGPDAYLKSGPQPDGAYVPLQLLTSGWHLNPATPFLTHQSPDNLIRLHRRGQFLQHASEMAGDTERWLFEVGPPRDVWYATASSRLPEHLLHTLATAVADPTPVYRHMWRVDLEHLPAVATATPTAPSPLEVARVRAASSRSLSVPRAAPSTLAYSTTTRPPALPRATVAGRSR